MIQDIINIIDLHKGKGYPEFVLGAYKVLTSSFNTTDKVKGKYTPKAGDKIYIFPGCTVPRFKIKQLCEKYNIALVKYKERATACFVGPGCNDELFESHTMYTASRKDFLEFITKAYGTEDPRFKDVIDTVSNNTHSVIVTTFHHTLSGLCDRNEYFNHFLYPKAESSKVERKSVKKVIDGAEGNIKFIAENENIYHQDDIISLLNVGNDLNAEEMISVKRLFQSKDKKDIILATELLCNCDYKKNAVSIMFLLYEFRTKIDNYANTSHVNFRTLKNFFKFDSVLHLDLDRMVNVLKYHGLLTSENVARLMPMAREIMNDNIGLTNFEVGDIQVKGDVIDIPFTSEFVPLFEEDVEEHLNCNDDGEE